MTVRSDLPAMLKRVDRILLKVPALPAAVIYYRDVLGLQLVRQDRQAAVFRMADQTAELVLRTDSDQPDEEIFYLVDNVRDLYQRRQELKLKFVQLPHQVTRGYRAAVKDPFGNVLQLLDRSASAGDISGAEDASPPTALFAGVEQHTPVRRQLLIDLYLEIGRTADDLPYTPQFEKLFAGYSANQDPAPSHQEVWRHLLNLRKAGKLPRLGEARSEAIPISRETEKNLRQLLGRDIGTRDRLPYSERFNQLVDDFNKTQRRPLSPHHVWRMAARLAK